MNYLKIDNCDIANGKGVGVVLWVQGCTICCEECHNPQSWDFNAGTEFTAETLQQLLGLLAKPYIKRLTITGGHPLELQNRKTVLDICKTVYDKFGWEKKIWLYTGYTLCDDHFDKESNGLLQNILLYCDYVVDGAYDKTKRDLTLAFRGSSNQRIIDCDKSFLEQHIVCTQFD